MNHLESRDYIPGNILQKTDNPIINTTHNTTHVLQEVNQRLKAGGRAYVFIDPKSKELGVTTDKKARSSLEDIAAHVNNINSNINSDSLLSDQEISPQIDEQLGLDMNKSFSELKTTVLNREDKKAKKPSACFKKAFSKIETSKEGIKNFTNNSLDKAGKMGEKACSWIKKSTAEIQNLPLGKSLSKVINFADKKLISLGKNLGTILNDFKSKTISTFNKASFNQNLSAAKETINEKISSFKEKAELKTEDLFLTLEYQTEKIERFIHKKLNPNSEKKVKISEESEVKVIDRNATDTKNFKIPTEIADRFLGGPGIANFTRGPESRNVRQEVAEQASDEFDLREVDKQGKFSETVNKFTIKIKDLSKRDDPNFDQLKFAGYNELKPMFKADQTPLGGFKEKNLTFVCDELIVFLETTSIDLKTCTAQDLKNAFTTFLKENTIKEEPFTKEEFKEYLDITTNPTLKKDEEGLQDGVNYEELKQSYYNGTWKSDEVKNLKFEGIPTNELEAVIKTSEKLFDLPEFMEFVKKAEV